LRVKVSCRACAALGQGLPYIFSRMTDVFEVVSSAYFTESICEREFVPQTLASGPTNNSRVDSRHSAGSPYFKPRYVVFIHAIFHFASYKPQRSYSRDAHAMRNFPVAIRCERRFKAEFLTDDIFPSQREILDSLHRELTQNQPFASSHALIARIACSIYLGNDIINAYAREWYFDNYYCIFDGILFVLKYKSRENLALLLSSRRKEIGDTSMCTLGEACQGHRWSAENTFRSRVVWSHHRIHLRSSRLDCFLTQNFFLLHPDRKPE